MDRGEEKEREGVTRVNITRKEGFMYKTEETAGETERKERR